MRLFARFFDLLIAAYQATLSPDHGVMSFFFPYGYCRFTPTCSMYVRQAIARHGCVRGRALGFRRLLRCTPFHGFGHDPVS
jgi:putative membrane protein insertion efficiency factor